MHSITRWPSLSLNTKLLHPFIWYAYKVSPPDFWGDTKNQGWLAVITHTATHRANTSLFSIQSYPMYKMVPARLYHSQRHFCKKQKVCRGKQKLILGAINRWENLFKKAHHQIKIRTITHGLPAYVFASLDHSLVAGERDWISTGIIV